MECDQLNFYDFSLDELSQKMVEWQEPAFRAKQLWDMVYKRNNIQPELFSNLPLALRQRLNESFNFSPLRVVTEVHSDDKQTNKYLLGLPDQKRIEAVLMRYRERTTICISSQVGCPMNCAFCATGQMGFIRNLSAGEIVAQIMFFIQELKNEERTLTNIVVMGMGEPFRNYDAVMKAVDIINSPDGLQFGERRITISTVGIIPMIDKFSKAKRQINLAVSLHAPTNAIRDKIMPVNRKYPIEPLLEACRNYTETTHRRITFEYALIRGVNDSIKEATDLAHELKGMLCHVNLIPLNSTSKYDGVGSPRERVTDFKMVLDRAGIPCSIRLKRGVDIGAGCGQLLAAQIK